MKSRHRRGLGIGVSRRLMKGLMEALEEQVPRPIHVHSNKRLHHRLCLAFEILTCTGSGSPTTWKLAGPLLRSISHNPFVVERQETKLQFVSTRVPLRRSLSLRPNIGSVRMRAWWARRESPRLCRRALSVSRCIQMKNKMTLPRRTIKTNERRAAKRRSPTSLMWLIVRSNRSSD